jgi:poly(3-hydroxybutyrate) depolymerase
MALRLARELSGTIAAVGVTLAGDAAGPYASPTPDPLAVSDTCTNQNSQATPVPMWMYKGVADSFILYNGGCNNPSANKADGCWLPYEPGEPGNLRSNNVTTISRVLARYGLASAPTASGPIFYNMNNGSDAGGQNSTVSCTYHYGSGTVGTLSRSDVEDCRATFAGHVDPSITVHLSALTQGVLGYQNYDIEAAVEQWNFFQNHPLP